MYCVKTTYAIENTIKKSRFIGLIIPCQTKQEALLHLNALQHKHPNANHIVFAYRIKTPKGIIIRMHDAGEPSGTAGKPVYQHLEGKDLINVICVVVRYFGGIKLGAGGLTRAYGNAAKNTIDGSIISEYIAYEVMNFELDYKQLKNFEYQLKKLDGKIIKQNFAEKICIQVQLPEGNRAILTPLFKA